MLHFRKRVVRFLQIAPRQLPLVFFIFKYSTHHIDVSYSISNIFHFSYIVQSETPTTQSSHPFPMSFYYFIFSFRYPRICLTTMWPILIWCNISFSFIFLILLRTKKNYYFHITVQCITTFAKSDTIYFTIFFCLQIKYTISFSLVSSIPTNVSIWKRNVLSVLGLAVVQIVSCLVYHFKDNIHSEKLTRNLCT